MEALRRDLLGWYDAHKRDLPWRRDQEPYRVLVSELMLQQTRVETVLRHYDAWLERFPTVEALAAATDEAVMAQWSGLGCYRRARSLHAAAQAIAQGGWPTDRAGLRNLPGIGDYTSAAVASIAWSEAVAAVDGNVVRVMSRLGDIEEDTTRAAGKRAVAAAADAALDAARPGDWNQAVMDLGARICTPKPRCDACPVAPHCQALARGTQAQRPVTRPKRPPVEQDVTFAHIVEGGRVLLVPRPADGLLAGTWGLPGGEGELVDEVRGQTGLEVRPADAAAEVVHRFTHRTWRMRIHDATVLGGELREPARWVPLDGLDALGLSTATRRAIDAAQAHARAGGL